VFNGFLLRCSALTNEYSDHLVHELLALYALGATPEEIDAGYKLNSEYQRSTTEPSPPIVDSLAQPEVFSAHLGKPDKYPDYLAFFKREIKQSGVEATVNKYVFADDVRAKDMFIRMFGGTSKNTLKIL
jgi:hypothetical protein